jgi:protein tyrosine phosphatase
MVQSASLVPKSSSSSSSPRGSKSGAAVGSAVDVDYRQSLQQHRSSKMPLAHLFDPAPAKSGGGGDATVTATTITTTAAAASALPVPAFFARGVLPLRKGNDASEAEYLAANSFVADRYSEADSSLVRTPLADVVASRPRLLALSRPIAANAAALAEYAGDGPRTAADFAEVAKTEAEWSTTRFYRESVELPQLMARDRFVNVCSSRVGAALRPSDMARAYYSDDYDTSPPVPDLAFNSAIVPLDAADLEWEGGRWRDVDGPLRSGRPVAVATQTHRRESDLWELALATGCRVVVALMRVEEVGDYFSDMSSSPRGKIKSVRVVSGPRFAGARSAAAGSLEPIVVRTIEVEHETRGMAAFRHVEVRSWPDQCVPSDAGLVFDALATAAGEGSAASKWSGAPFVGAHAVPTPMIVHCLAGIGRTGSFCLTTSLALSLSLHAAATASSSSLSAAVTVDPVRILARMRVLRPGFVQKKEQYAYACRAAALAAQMMKL